MASAFQGREGRWVPRGVTGVGWGCVLCPGVEKFTLATMFSNIYMYMTTIKYPVPLLKKILFLHFGGPRLLTIDEPLI